MKWLDSEKTAFAALIGLSVPAMASVAYWSNEKDKHIVM